MPKSTLSILAVLPMLSALGQQPAPRPAFEVADIKPAAPGDIAPGKERLLPGGRIEIPHATVKELMIGAYSVQSGLIFGGPKWLETDRFDIVAKAPDPNTPVPTLLLMVRTLLEDRFKLVVHREDRVMPAYTLAVGKDGSRLRPSTAGGRQNCNSQMLDNAGIRVLRRECRNMTMDEFARQLALPGFGLDRQVVNATDLRGPYDFEFDYVPQMAGRGDDRRSDSPAAADLPSGPTILEAVTHLGLKLEAGKRPVSVVVIDSAAKPGEN